MLAQVPWPGSGRPRPAGGHRAARHRAARARCSRASGHRCRLRRRGKHGLRDTRAASHAPTDHRRRSADGRSRPWRDSAPRGRACTSGLRTGYTSASGRCTAQGPAPAQTARHALTRRRREAPGRHGPHGADARRGTAPPFPSAKEHHHVDIHPHRALREVHRGVQAHPLGHRPRRDPRPRVRLRQEVPARRPVAGRRLPFLAGRRARLLLRRCRAAPTPTCSAWSNATSAPRCSRSSRDHGSATRWRSRRWSASPTRSSSTRSCSAASRR